MTVYENAKVLNTFLLINWLTIYFNGQGIVYLFLMRMKYYKMCFSNIERVYWHENPELLPEKCLPLQSDSILRDFTLQTT